MRIMDGTNATDKTQPFYIGTAGWNVPAESRHRFPAEGSHLARYAACFNAAEINSSFYRPHRPATYRRWAETVPDEFRFSVKLPKEITHRKRLVGVEADLDEFLTQATSLGTRLGPILVQLPPSFAFDEGVAVGFFARFRARFTGRVVFEPRHATWFDPAVDQMLAELRIARVAADPAPVPAAADPGGWEELVYYRAHGSPRVYYSPYDPAFLGQLALQLRAAPAERWCIFDNTALGYAAGDALRLSEMLSQQ